MAGYLRACRRRQVGQRIAPGIGAMLLGFSALLYQHASQSRYPPAQAAYAFLVSLYLLPVRELDMVPVKAGSLRMGDVAGDGFFDDALPVHTVAVAAPFHVAWSARSSASSAASTAPG